MDMLAGAINALIHMNQYRIRIHLYGLDIVHNLHRCMIASHVHLPVLYQYTVRLDSAQWPCIGTQFVWTVPSHGHEPAYIESQ